MSVIQEIPAGTTVDLKQVYETGTHFNEMLSMLSARLTGNRIKDEWIENQIRMYADYSAKLVQMLITYEVYVQAPEPPAVEQPVVGSPAPKKPWYPDDSGEWVEVTFGRKPSLPKDTRIFWLTGTERSKRDYLEPEPELVENLSWSVICAYKVAK